MNATSRFDEAQTVATQFGFTLELRQAPSSGKQVLVLEGQGQTFHSHPFLSQKVAMLYAPGWVQRTLLQDG